MQSRMASSPSYGEDHLIPFPFKDSNGEYSQYSVHHQRQEYARSSCFSFRSRSYNFRFYLFSKNTGHRAIAASVGDDSRIGVKLNQRTRTSRCHGRKQLFATASALPLPHAIKTRCLVLIMPNAYRPISPFGALDRTIKISFIRVNRTLCQYSDVRIGVKQSAGSLTRRYAHSPRCRSSANRTTVPIEYFIVPTTLLFNILRHTVGNMCVVFIDIDMIK